MRQVFELNICNLKYEFMCNTCPSPSFYAKRCDGILTKSLVYADGYKYCIPVALFLDTKLLFGLRFFNSFFPKSFLNHTFHGLTIFQLHILSKTTKNQFFIRTKQGLIYESCNHIFKLFRFCHKISVTYFSFCLKSCTFKFQIFLLCC